jgi:hypothetical protein
MNAVLKMATAAANKHLDALAGKQKPFADLAEAVAATWQLVKGRLGSSEAVRRNARIDTIVGNSAAKLTAQQIKEGVQ